MISVREHMDSGVTVIEPGPRLTLENSQEILDTILAVPVAISPAIVVNLERTTMIDSTGIGTLVNAMKHFRSMKGSLVLAGLRPEILRSFRLMNLHQVFDIYDTETLARQQLNGRRV